MPLIVDTFNVLHVVGVLPPDLAGLELPGLVELMASSRFRGQAVFLVCDGVGKPPTDPPPGISVLFSGPGRTADEMIVDLTQRASHPRQLRVVTADRDLQRRVRRQKARILDPARFLKHLVNDRNRAHTAHAKRQRSSHAELPQQTVEAWAAYLKIDLDHFDPSELAPPEDADQHDALQSESAAPTEINPSPTPPQRRASKPQRHPDFTSDVLDEARRLLEEDDQG